MAHKELVDGRNINTAEDEWKSGIDFGENSNTYKLLRALLSEAERIDDELEAIYEQQHISTATGEDLERFGDLVGVSRRSGESDEGFRARIKANFAASTTLTTWDDFAEFAASVLETDINKIDLQTDYEVQPATIRIISDSSVYEDTTLSNTDLVDVLGSGVPAGHEVLVEEIGTFRVKSDGTTDDPDKGLTSDSISTGGTLSSDLLS